MFSALASDPKNGTARATFKKWQIDVWRWAEINVNWLLLKQSDTLEYRCKDWFENMAVITSNNKTIKDHMKLKMHQWGGHILSGKMQVGTTYWKEGS
jgi:hypothetical protein